jgi:DNA polymerase-3 subunit alpha
MQPRWQYSDVLDLKVQNIEFLQTVKDKSVDRITITLKTDLEAFNEQIVTELGEIVMSCPGTTKLFFQLRDTVGKHHVLLRSQKGGVDVRHTLIDYIESHSEVMDYKIN